MTKGVKNLTTISKEWAKHLRLYGKKFFWSGERTATRSILSTYDVTDAEPYIKPTYEPTEEEIGSPFIHIDGAVYEASYSWDYEGSGTIGIFSTFELAEQACDRTIREYVENGLFQPDSYHITQYVIDKPDHKLGVVLERNKYEYDSHMITRGSI